MKFFISPIFLKSAKAFYLWLMALCIGGIFSVGAFSASVIFNAQDFSVNLDRFNAGILMSEIFSRFNALLIFVAFVIVFYEILYARLSSAKTLQKILLCGSGIISVVGILLFALYYSPNIIALQQSKGDFDALHTQSEWVFHAIFFTLSFNFIYRILYD